MKLLYSALICIAVASLPAPVAAETAADQVKVIRKDASVTFSQDYEVESPLSVVKTAIEHPLLMSALWASYQYAPPYEVTMLDKTGAVQVKDPTGIEGVLRPAPAEDNHVVYVAEGKLNHWALPVMNRGSAVFDFKLSPKGNGTTVNVTVSVKPGNFFGRAAAWMLTPVVKGRIDSRVTNNFRDAAQIFQKISTEPTAVAARLQQDQRPEFEQLFSAQAAE